MKVRPAKAVCPVKEIKAWEQDPSSEGDFSSTLESVKQKESVSLGGGGE
jgi:hypothetical protein